MTSTIEMPRLPGDVPSLTSSTLNHVAKVAVNKGRATRNALYRHAQFLNSLPEGAKAYHKDNREAQGLPRAYSIQFADPTVDQDHPELKKLNGQTLIIGEHGSNNTGMLLNGHRISPSHTAFSPATSSYSFKATIPATEGQQNSDVAGFVSLIGQEPSGVLSVGNRTFNIRLDPRKVWFNVNISANAGAYFSTGDSTLKWDITSSAWKGATWETAGLTFGYDTKNIGDDIQARWATENTFIDNASTPPTKFDLAASAATYGSIYTCTMSTGSGPDATMVTDVIIPPPAAPASRANMPIKSVFPTLWEITFSPFGDSFNGAYKDANGDVYAVSGTVKLDDTESLVNILSTVPEGVPVKNINPVTAAEPGPSASTSQPAPLPGANEPASNNINGKLIGEGSMEPSFSMMTTTVSSQPPLTYLELLNMNPMVPDSTSASNYRDSVAELAMQDFHELIIYFMDSDLRTTFIQATAPVLTPDVLAVATDDAASGNGENKTFYQSLQVPYIVSMLAAGTVSQGKYCNGLRANNQLKDIPTHSDVYKRHSAKLYRIHYLQHFPAMNQFLQDQNNTDYTSQIDVIGNQMKSDIAAKSANVNDPSNPDYSKQLAAAQNDVSNLITWAKDQSLYWALQLLYYVENSALTNWYTQYTTGTNTSSLSMMQKQLNTLFGMLENNRVNPSGPNFMEAYNDDMRLFQMTSIIPTLVDIRGNSVEITTLIDECLADYIENFKVSTNPDHVAALAAAEQLYGDKQLQQKFWDSLASASRVGVAASSWRNTMYLWEKTIVQANWFKRLAAGGRLLAVFEAATGAVLLLLPLIPGMWDKMDSSQKLAWKLALAGLCGTIVIGIMQGLLRFYYLYGDISGFWPSLKCCLGFESVVDAIPNAAEKIQGGFTKFFTRTWKQTLRLQENTDNGLVAEGEGFTKVERVIGRNVGEVIGTVAGLALAAASIYSSIIDLERQGVPALRAMDILMIISSAIQILAVAAGMVAAFTTGTTLAAVTLCATWGGPVAIVFAIAGLIVYLIWESKQTTVDPLTAFLDDDAGPANLRMPGEKQAPEYFGIVPATSSDAALVGLAISGPLTSAPETQQQYLKLDTDAMAPALVGQPDYSLDTIWSLETDPYGNSKIYTAAYSNTTDPAGQAITTQTLWYLGTSDDSTQVVFRQLPSEDQSADQHKQVLPHVQWTIDVLTTPTQDVPDVVNGQGVVTKPGNVLSAQVSISQGGAQLGRWIDPQTMQMDAGLSLVTDGNAVNSAGKQFCENWLFKMEPIGPPPFKYLRPHWTIYDTDTDTTDVPHFSQVGTSSSGLQWTITPALPAGVLELVTSSDADELNEGTIQQVSGKTAPVMAATTYTVSCSLVYQGKICSTQTAEIVIEVVHDTADD
ncbi:uncharacterized protein FPRO_08695 [Fusarium proliferatum ET1]|uniref:Uncharacterized protein n=1 Tax=Fusarium proliferatum (strain ET1) TaxID=1227346 RepID=A0A1L7W4T2_FUSPR|nr:uncharacterized protein FPRO_08695 [Fusarium proliferatum ET1]CZR47321.1 uncharacterized protein FPRO_08695 [Fusarium proliferatum ET1]